jgi:hypothetical protein
MIRRLSCIIAALVVVVLSTDFLKARDLASVSFDRDKAFVGDIIGCKITAELGENENISANQDITFNNFDVEGYEIKHISQTPNVYEIDLKITAYKTGLLELEPAAVNYLDASGADKQFFTPASKFEVASVLSGQDGEIKDIKPLRTLQRGKGYIILMVLAAAAAAIFIFLLLKDVRKQRTEAADAEIILSPREKALKNLLEIYEVYKNGKYEIKIFYYKMSEILRTYVSEKYNFNALEMTTAEFFEKVKRSLPREVNVNEFKNYLKVFSLARYAGFKPSEAEIKNNFDYTKNLLELL